MLSTNYDVSDLSSSGFCSSRGGDRGFADAVPHGAECQCAVPAVQPSAAQTSPRPSCRQDANGLGGCCPFVLGKRIGVPTRLLETLVLADLPASRLQPIFSLRRFAPSVPSFALLSRFSPRSVMRPGCISGWGRSSASAVKRPSSTFSLLPVRAAIARERRIVVGDHSLAAAPRPCLLVMLGVLE